MKNLILLICCCLSFSCASVNVEKAVAAETGSGHPQTASVVAVPIDSPQPVIIQQPVYVPEKNAPPAAKSSVPGVKENTENGIKKPQNYSHAAVVYDYSEDWVYEVYCQPMRVTDVRLKPGEQAVEPPFVSDSERWMLGAGVSYENGVAVQHIYVKPQVAGIDATLIINTNEREYHLIVRSYQNTHMPIVRWRYIEPKPPSVFIRDEANKGLYANRSQADAALADPRFLSFNYKIIYSLFSKPRWLPKLAYDDGTKTYISFPRDVLQAELPAVFENRNTVVNYRVSENVIIIDKLIETVSIKMGKYTVSVTKKRGAP